MKLKKGLVQIYTGCGKGKTSAAFGLALRAAGAGLKVYICQFIKSKTYSELKTLKKINGLRIEQFGRGCFIKGRPKKEDVRRADEGLQKAMASVSSGKYDVAILDEINVALRLGLIKTENIIKLIKDKPKHVELVLTGRGCPRLLFKYVDLITEMKEVKHPYQKGLKARRGIEY